MASNFTIALVLGRFRSSTTQREVGPKRDDWLEEIGNSGGNIAATRGFLALGCLPFSRFVLVHLLPTFFRTTRLLPQNKDLPIETGRAAPLPNRKIAI